MIYRTTILMMSILTFVVPLSAMRQNMILHDDVDYKRRERSALRSLCPMEDNQYYPYFLSQQNDTYARRSFLDELLFATRVLKPELPKEIIGTILQWSYYVYQRADKKLIQKYKQAFGDDGKSLLYVHELHKQALLYVSQKGLHKKKHTLRIEGVNKDFARKVSENIVSLSLPIRKQIVHRFGSEMMCNVNYEPLLHDIILDHKKNKKCCISCCLNNSTVAGCYVCHNIDCWLCPHYTWTRNVMNLIPVWMVNGRIIRACMFFAIDSYMIYVLLLLPLAYLTMIMERVLRETPYERDRRHGFERISLLTEMEEESWLQEMKCEIVEK